MFQYSISSYLCIMNTIHQLSQYALCELKDSYPDHEIRSICHIIYMDLLHFTNIDIHLRKNENLDKSFIDKFIEIILQLKSGQPLQYLLGITEFCGHRFRVNPSTLIPRPETAELVRWATTCVPSSARILDIGTGSGCIAVTLAYDHPGCQVTGIDISTEALHIAWENAVLNHTDVRFLQRDILSFGNFAWDKYDIIISNPPYIRESEKNSMEKNVLDHEPHSALFVPDTDPLLFYRRIGEFGQQYLSSAGQIFFEINEALGGATVSLLRSLGYRNIQLKKDFDGKDRMIRAVKPEML